MVQFKNIDALESYMEQNSSLWSVYNNEAMYAAYIASQKRALQLLQNMLDRLQTQPYEKIFEELYNIERQMTTSGPVKKHLMRLLAVEITDHFAKTAPTTTEASMHDCYQDVMQVWKTPFLYDNKEYTLRQLSGAFRWPHRTSCKELIDSLGEEGRKQLQNEMAQKLYEVSHRQKYSTSVEGHCGSILLEHMWIVLEHHASEGVLTCLGYEKVYKLLLQKHLLLPWTTIGPIMAQGVERGELKANLLGFEPQGRVIIEKLVHVVLPQYVEKLAAIQQFLEQRIHEVSNLRSKLLAAGISGTVSVGSALANWLINSTKTTTSASSLNATAS